MAFDTDVLIIGAGPIGLINAWGMKQLNSNLKIVILEKNTEYQRSHTLVMKAAKLEALLKAIKSEQEPTLVALLEQLKNDPHIRTNHLQQLFTKLAQESGIEIKTGHEVHSNTIEQMINDEYPNVSLIIGADGTHSVVSEALFPIANQVKHEFDFVLQLRFEINGEEKASKIGAKTFYQQMARHGLIANEYVGHFDEGKTPVTMQMMISKEDFLRLKKATSKNPLKPYATSEYEENQQELELEYDENQRELKHDEEELLLPRHLNSFLSTYLKNKIDKGHHIERNSIRISVNEAPVTYANTVVHQQGEASVVLMGDAALGLSYFKGLGAGLTESTLFLRGMSSVFKDSFQNKDAMATQLQNYQTWFLRDFSPKKVKEVGRYSFWRIRSAMQVMQVARGFKTAFMPEVDDDLNPAIVDYFNYYTTDPLVKGSNQRWRPFPHREYNLVKFGQFDYVPLKHTAKKIAKIFVDYFQPYKSKNQLVQDFKQPLVGVVNFFVGLGKVIAGIFTLHFWILADGLFSSLRGIIELITTPLAWFLKPITRGIATLIHGGWKKIEENTGMQHLAQYGLNYLDETDESELRKERTIYELLAICNDMHRKFEKACERGQASKYQVEELLRYSGIRTDTVLSREKLNAYFSLFVVKNEKQENTLELSDVLDYDNNSLSS